MLRRNVANRAFAVEARVEAFLSQEVPKFCQNLAALEAQIGSDAEPEKESPLHDRVLEAFMESQDACRRFELDVEGDPQTIQDVQRVFRSETAQWFNQSWFAHRSRTKPSGFPGDYEMLLALYRGSTSARGIGGYLDLCLLDLPLARAVRTRLQAVRRFLLAEIDGQRESLRILDIGSGPCSEYLDWPTRDRGELDIVAMDMDPKAVDYVNSQVVPQLPDRVRLNAVRYNALRTRVPEATIEKFGRFDLIYSVGLCDYLSDDILIDLLQAWRLSLNSGGVLYVAFKDTQRYPKEPYQWHLDWFFYQRTRSDCERLYRAAGFDIAELEMIRDETSIIMNFVSRQRGAVPEPHLLSRAARRSARRLSSENAKSNG